MKKAFITGISGQDGSYLSEILLEKGYEVHGIIRRSSVFTSDRIDHLFDNKDFYTYHGDLSDSSNLHRLINQIGPDEIYNLGAQSHVAVSFEVPEYTADVDAIGTIRILDAIRDLNKKCKYYQASTSELFGGIPGTEPQNESTPFYPKSPYGVAKLYAYWMCVNYREAYDIFASNGILFNHESPRRGETFVTKKITKAVSNIVKNKQDNLVLGNLDAKRDWGHAKDYAYAQWLILQHDRPEDYVIASGETHTIREFVELAFQEVDIQIIWDGEGINEKGLDSKTKKVLVEVSEDYLRPAEVEILHGDPSKAEKDLGWKRRITFKELVSLMVKYDLENDGYGGQE